MHIEWCGGGDIGGGLAGGGGVAENARLLALVCGVGLLLLVAEFTLGILTVLMRSPADIASAHVAVGSLVFVTAWVMVVRTAGLRRFAARNERAEVSKHASEEVGRSVGAFGSPTVRLRIAATEPWIRQLKSIRCRAE